jgi:TonB family protein
VNLAYVSLLLRQTNKAQSEAAKAIALDPKNTSAYYLRGSASLWEGKLDDAKRDADTALSTDPAKWQGYMLQAGVLLARLSKEVAGEADIQAVKDHIGLLRDARDTLRSGAEKTNRNKQITDELEAVEAFYDYFSKDGSAPPSAFPEPGVTPLKIIEKPRASYTDAARQSNTQGIIRIAVIFGASGKIEHVLLLKRLGFGLDNEALKAVQKIRFEPKKINGTPVSSVRLVEYGFSIY